VFAFEARYLSWRLGTFPWSNEQNGTEWLWWLLVLGIELAVIIEVTLFLLTVSWLTDRRYQADEAEKKLRKVYATAGKTAIPSVDIFITTYNEGPEVLEKSILGASEIDYPNFTVWVLDDGHRPWLKQFCDEAAVGYISRPNNQGAKAGNINHALKQTQGDLVMLMDADFVAYRNSIWRTAGLFSDQRIGTVQTPQNFFNPDAIQHNLGISLSWCDEQSFFFRLIARGRDALGVAFCCGSCSVHRREALISSDGFPTDSITEDILLTVNFCRLGWKTIYLAEPISTGLAAETLDSFFIQRKRWGRGGIQVAWLMLKKRGINLIQRIFFFPYSWITQYNSRLFFQIVPIVFFFTGVAPLPEVEAETIIGYQASFLAVLMVSITVLSEGYYMPIFNEAISLFASFELAPEITAAIIRPFSKGFAVTPKGNDSLSGAVMPYRRTLLPTSILLILNVLILLRILFSIGGSVSESSSGLLVYGFIWCIFNITLLILSVLLSLQKAQPRLEHRMLINRSAHLIHADGTRTYAKLIDLSLTGGLLRTSNGDTPQEERICGLELETNARIPIKQQWNRKAGLIALKFGELEMATKKKLVGYAFSGEFKSAEQPQKVEFTKTLRQIIGEVTRSS
jgi:cellulose synthase (UDP-forming)